MIVLNVLVITSDKPDKDSRRKGKREFRKYFYRKRIRSHSIFERQVPYIQRAPNHPFAPFFFNLKYPFKNETMVLPMPFTSGWGESLAEV